MLTPLNIAVLTVLMPFIVAPLSHVISRLPRIGENAAKAICVLTAYLSFFLTSTLIPIFHRDPLNAYLFSITLPIGTVNLGLYVDCFSLIPASLSSLFTALALSYNLYYLSPYNRAYKIGWEFNRSYSFILLFNGAMLGALFSNNLLSLLIFWEMVSLCSYMLISFWSKNELSLAAAIKALIMTHIGGLALLIAAIIIYSVAGTLEIPILGQKIPVGDPITYVVFPLLLITALPKTVLFPFYTWLPDSVIAPTSMILIFHESGTLTGIYLIIRFFMDTFRSHTSFTTAIQCPMLGSISMWGFIISLIGSITLLIGGLNGLVESDFKRIVAYGSISGLGYIAMATGLATPLSITAALFLTISHAFTFGLLFLCAGSVVYATGKHDVNDIGGLYQQMPITALCCLIGVLSMSTVPLLSDFAGKYLVYSAIINAKAPLFIIIASLGCILNAAVAIRLFYSVFLRRDARVPHGLIVKDPAVSMILPMILMSMAIVIFGVAPTALLSLFITPAIRQIFNEELVNIVSQQGFIETHLGFWNPIATALTIIVFFTAFTIIIFCSRKTRLAYRATVSEEAVKPFICGEDSKILENPQAYHLYHVLAVVLRIDILCHALNIDRIYNLLSARFFSLMEKVRCLDIQQSYFPAVLSFTLGALIMAILAVLVG